MPLRWWQTQLSYWKIHHKKKKYQNLKYPHATASRGVWRVGICWVFYWEPKKHWLFAQCFSHCQLLYFFFFFRQKITRYSGNHINLHKAVPSKIKSKVGYTLEQFKEWISKQKANRPDGHGTGQAWIDQW